MVNVAIFASGSGSNFECIVNAKKAHSNVTLLIVDKDDAYAIQRAKKLQIPYVYVNPKAFTSKEAYEECIVGYLVTYGVHLIALAGYMRFIGEVLLKQYKRKILNLHPAYLPNFPGAHSIQEAFEAKVPYSGVTIHYVDEGIDTGEIIYQEKLFLDPSWSLEDFEREIHQLEYKLFPEVLNQVCEEEEDEASIN